MTSANIVSRSSMCKIILNKLSKTKRYIIPFEYQI